VPLKCEGRLEVDDVVTSGGDGVAEEEDTLSGEKGPRFLNGVACCI
tara:strand:+ start:1411 stop:1548 length:138 start_codon:yes stop_codon:yes gene_type:complete